MTSSTRLLTGVTNTLSSPASADQSFYKHPLFSKECEEEYRKALKETGVEISSFICVYRWSGPTEEQRKMAVANWKDD